MFYRFKVSGIFEILVDAYNMAEARQVAENILKNKGVEALAIEVEKIEEEGKR